MKKYKHKRIGQKAVLYARVRDSYDCICRIGVHIWALRLFIIIPFDSFIFFHSILTFPFRSPSFAMLSMYFSRSFLLYRLYVSVVEQYEDKRRYMG